jgi:hypothetical protein
MVGTPPLDSPILTTAELCAIPPLVHGLLSIWTFVYLLPAWQPRQISCT